MKHNFKNLKKNFIKRFKEEGFSVSVDKTIEFDKNHTLFLDRESTVEISKGDILFKLSRDIFNSLANVMEPNGIFVKETILRDPECDDNKEFESVKNDADIEELESKNRILWFENSNIVLSAESRKTGNYIGEDVFLNTHSFKGVFENVEIYLGLINEDYENKKDL